MSKTGNRKFITEIIDKIQDWICIHTQVVNSPLKNDHMNIKDNTKIEVIITKKLLIQIPIRELHND